MLFQKEKLTLGRAAELTDMGTRLRISKRICTRSIGFVGARDRCQRRMCSTCALMRIDARSAS